MNSKEKRYRQTLARLRVSVYTDTKYANNRNDVIAYVEACRDYARQAQPQELMSGLGDDIAGNICGALAWQIGDSGTGWLTKESEPALWQILEIASALDVDANQPAAWRDLLHIKIAP